MAGNFNLNNGFKLGTPNFGKIVPQSPQAQPQAEQTQKGKNPFDVDAIFTFKKPDLVYDRVMKSAEMFDFLKAQKVAGQFIDLTKPDYEVGKKLNFEA